MTSEMLDRVYVGAEPDVFSDVQTNSSENDKHYDTNINQVRLMPICMLDSETGVTLHDDV